MGEEKLKREFAILRKQTVSNSKRAARLCKNASSLEGMGLSHNDCRKVANNLRQIQAMEMQIESLIDDTLVAAGPVIVCDC